MDVVLLTLTTLSLAAAAGFGFLPWRLGREERQREQARVAALATAMTGPSAIRGRDEAAPPSMLRGFGETGRRLGEAFPSEADTPETQVAVGSVFERATAGLLALAEQSARSRSEGQLTTTPQLRFCS